ncbi:XdhC family protein [Neorhizobium sp. BT27B]|uniref:XdhC family protein n=1 Tax=Neorhizobium sp. BT27B TaxID=3142625 RepID=UPI003D2A3D35
MNAQVFTVEYTAPMTAFVTDDPVEILRYASASFRDGIPVALVTLVEIRGGAARPLGAQMTVRIDGLYCGFVSGGCTEAAVAAEAIEALKAGHDRFLLLGEGSPFFDVVLPCGGGIRLSIHVVKAIEPVDEVLSQLALRREAGLLYSAGAEAIAYVESVQTGWQSEGFSRIYKPSTRLFISGNALEANALARVAMAVGYEVNQVGRAYDKHLWDVSADKYSAVALLNHDLAAELPALEAALKSSAFYIGALGSRRTHDKRKQALKSLGYDDAEVARIKAPIGMFDKARDAASLAVSVVADITALTAVGLKVSQSLPA